MQSIHLACITKLKGIFIHSYTLCIKNEADVAKIQAHENKNALPNLSRYQIAVIILIYLLPLLVMLVTYSMVGQRLWGSKIPGEASDHYQNQIQAKRKVRFNPLTHYFYTHKAVHL